MQSLVFTKAFLYTCSIPFTFGVIPKVFVIGKYDINIISLDRVVNICKLRYNLHIL